VEKERKIRDRAFDPCSVEQLGCKVGFRFNETGVELCSVGFTPVHQRNYTTAWFAESVWEDGPMSNAERRSEIAEKVRSIISEQLGVDEAEITPSASFTDDLGADSLDQVELVMALEEAYDLEIGDEDVENMKTVQNAIDYLEKNAKHAKQAKAGK